MSANPSKLDRPNANDASVATGPSPSPVNLHDKNPFAISVLALFQITTACCIFFACLKISPLLAIGLTIFITPAIIRTKVISELHRRSKLEFGIGTRLRFFFSSMGIMLLIGTTAASVFTMTCAFFAAMGMLLNAVGGSYNLSLDAAVVGASGGMILGIAAAILVVVYVAVKTWIPRQLAN